jgi:hypothetical protein
LNQCLRTAPRILHNALVADVEQPPPNCPVKYQAIESGFRLSVPPAGLWRGSLQVFPVAVGFIVWVPGVLTCLWLFTDAADMPGPFLAVFVFITAANVLAGIAALLLGIYLGTRRADASGTAGEVPDGTRRPGARLDRHDNSSGPRPASH